jgi:hypothetical protein
MSSRPRQLWLSPRRDVRRGVCAVGQRIAAGNAAFAGLFTRLARLFAATCGGRRPSLVSHCDDCRARRRREVSWMHWRRAIQRKLNQPNSDSFSDQFSAAKFSTEIRSRPFYRERDTARDHLTCSMEDNDCVTILACTRTPFESFGIGSCIVGVFVMWRAAAFLVCTSLFWTGVALAQTPGQRPSPPQGIDGWAPTTPQAFRQSPQTADP